MFHLRVQWRLTASEQVNFFPSFVKGETANVTDVADHVEHIANIAGRKQCVYKLLPSLTVGLWDCVNSVGLGSDFDGIGTVPEGLEDVSKYPALVIAFICRLLSPVLIPRCADCRDVQARLGRVRPCWTYWRKPSARYGRRGARRSPAEESWNEACDGQIRQED